MVSGFSLVALSDRAKPFIDKFNVKDKKAFIEKTDDNTLKVLFYARYAPFIPKGSIEFFVCDTMTKQGLVRDVDYKLEVY